MSHEFRFLGNIELYERPLRPLKLKVAFDSAQVYKSMEFRHGYEAASAS